MFSRKYWLTAHHSSIIQIGLGIQRQSMHVPLASWALGRASLTECLTVKGGSHSRETMESGHVCLRRTWERMKRSKKFLRALHARLGDQMRFKNYVAYWGSLQHGWGWPVTDNNGDGGVEGCFTLCPENRPWAAPVLEHCWCSQGRRPTQRHSRTDTSVKANESPSSRQGQKAAGGLRPSWKGVSCSLPPALDTIQEKQRTGKGTWKETLPTGQ